MFEQADQISLMINPLNNQDVRFRANGTGDTTSVEIILRGGSLTISQPVQYDADGYPFQNQISAPDIKEQVFYLERDPQNPALWVIAKWFDLGQ
jgi:hypothetical protein